MLKLYICFLCRKKYFRHYHKNKILKFCSVVCRQKFLKGKNHPRYGKLPWNKEKPWSFEVRKKMIKNHKGMTGKHQSIKTIKKISQKNKGQIPWILGKHHTEKTRRKQRFSQIKYIKEIVLSGQKFGPVPGKFEKQYLDEIELSNNMKIQRDFTCVGFFPDGYHKESNTIIEIDEPFHRRDKIKNKDKFRDKELFKELNCNIARISI